MTLAELIAEYRDESGDMASPPFLSDDKLIRLANQAEQEACRRSSLLIESVDAMCSVDVYAGAPIVTLDRKIISIISARMASAAYQLMPITLSCLPYQWEALSGAPTNYVTDYQSGAIRLFPAPIVDDTLILTVRRLPLMDMEDDDDEPEIRPEYHQALVHWMLYRAYSKQDADMLDPQKAARSLAEFEREFGRRHSARNEQWATTQPTATTQPIA